MRGDAPDGLDKAARVAPNISEVEEWEEWGSPVLDSGSEFKKEKKKKAKVGGEEKDGDEESNQYPTPSR
jgi:hypothetical protein